MSHSDCVFCKIVAGEIPSPRVFEDETCIVIRDIQPQAKIHLLVIPKQHLASLNEAFPENGASQTALVGRLLETASRVARKEGMSEYRVVTNTGITAGQSVFHLHLHVAGGEPLRGSFGR